MLRGRVNRRFEPVRFFSGLQPCESGCHGPWCPVTPGLAGGGYPAHVFSEKLHRRGADAPCRTTCL